MKIEAQKERMKQLWIAFGYGSQRKQKAADRFAQARALGWKAPDPQTKAPARPAPGPETLDLFS